MVVCARDPHGATATAALCGADTGPYAPLSGATLVVSAVPPSARPQDAVTLADRPVVCDLAYGGLQTWTPLVEEARSNGCQRSVDGRGMLVEQAALALAHWTGEDPERLRAVMHQAMPAPL